MTLWERLQDFGILKRSEQVDISAEAERFKSDPAFQQYVDTAKFNIITQFWSLEITDIDGFQQLKRCQQALDGLPAYIDNAIYSEMLKNRKQ